MKRGSDPEALVIYENLSRDGLAVSSRTKRSIVEGSGAVKQVTLRVE